MKDKSINCWEISGYARTNPRFACGFGKRDALDNHNYRWGQKFKIGDLGLTISEYRNLAEKDGFFESVRDHIIFTYGRLYQLEEEMNW